MEDLQNRGIRLETEIKEHESRELVSGITEEQVKHLFSMFKGFVLERNLPECKKFIQNYVDKVIVYKDHVEVILSVVFDFLKKKEALKITKSAKKRSIFKYYGNIA